jgi:hypothetical protein
MKISPNTKAAILGISSFLLLGVALLGFNLAFHYRASAGVFAIVLFFVYLYQIRLSRKVNVK